MVVGNSAELVDAIIAGLRELGEPPVVVRRVASPGDAQRALDDELVDLVVCYDTDLAITANELVGPCRDQLAAPPCIVVGQGNDPARAIACLRAGAIDHLDGAAPLRLARALQRELNHCRERRRLAEEQQRLVGQLVRAQREETLGRLARCVAHEFNNALTVILSFAGFVRDDLGAEDPRRRDIAEVLRAADHASVLARQLHSFGQQPAGEARAVSINDVLANQERLLHRLVGERGELVYELSTALWPTCIDTGRFEQLIINLVVNARDAIELGGRIRLRTLNAPASPGGGDGAARTATDAPQDRVLIELWDSGHGVTPTQPDSPGESQLDASSGGRAFDLTVCRLIARQAGGSIEFESPPAGGRLVRVALPRSPGPSSATRNNAAVRGAPRAETVLVVAPDSRVNDIVRRTLDAAGLRVLAATSTEQALGVMGRQAGALALLVADTALPGLGAPGLARELMLLHPSLRVLLLAGSTADHPRSDELSAERVTLVTRPFSGSQLLAVVHRILDPRA